MLRRRRESSVGRYASCKKFSDREIDWRKGGVDYKRSLSAWSNGSNLKMFLKEYSNRRSVREEGSIYKNKSYWLLL